MENLNRKQKENLIYRFKHKDYKGRTTEGKKSVMPSIAFRNKTCLVTLSTLSDSEFDRLWELENENDYILKKEQKRLEKKNENR